MYIVAIGWMYVVLMASVANTTVVGGVLTFVFAGLGPLALFLWIFGTPARRRRMFARERALAAREAEQDAPSDER